jgi:hypothetical protein
MSWVAAMGILADDIEKGPLHARRTGLIIAMRGQRDALPAEKT